MVRVVWERFHSSRRKDYPRVDKSTEITLSTRPDAREEKGNSRGRQDGKVVKRKEQQETGQVGKEVERKGRDRTGQDGKGAEKRGERGTELDGKEVETREWRREDR